MGLTERRSQMMQASLVLLLAVSAGCSHLGVSAGPFRNRYRGSRILQSTNGRLVVEVLDPAAPPAYMDRRFSHAAFVLQARHDGRLYTYASVNHARKTGFLGGIPMEFDINERTWPPGYADAKVGESFLKVGVGVLERDSENDYQFSHAYPVIERAATDVEWGGSAATFKQRLQGNARGYAYALDVQVSLTDTQLRFDYRLKNTGTRPFSTEQYLHNFMRLGTDLSSAYRVMFPHPVVVCTKDCETLDTPTSPFVLADSQTVSFERSPAKWGGKQFVKAAEGTAALCSFALENEATGQRVLISCSRPVTNVALWTTEYQISPEANMLLTLEPGEEALFSRSYTFGRNE